MENKYTSTEDIWFIIKSDENIHYGKIKSGETLETINQIDTYSNEEEWKVSLKRLGIEKTEIKPQITSFEIPKRPSIGKNLN